MIVKINAYELESENIVDYYPCDVLGERQEQGIWTFIEYKDGFNGIYLFNASKLTEKLQACAYLNKGKSERVGCKITDDAQAIEHSLLPLSGEADNAYMRGYEVGKAEGIMKANARPTGELKKLYGDKYYCSKCGKDCEQLYKRFCGYCGAELQ